MVPSTPKLSAGSGSETVTSQVPTFMFQSATNPEAIGGASVSGASGTGSTTFGALAAQASSSTSGQSGVKGASQEGIDRTSVDILQFTGGSAATGTSTTSTPTGFAAASAPTGFAALAQMAPTKRKSLLQFFLYRVVGILLNGKLHSIHYQSGSKIPAVRESCWSRKYSLRTNSNFTCHFGFY